MRYRLALVLALLLAPAAVPAFAQDHDSRVRDLLRQIGIVDEARHAVEQHLFALRDARQDVYGEFWVEFMSTVRPGRLLDALTTHFAARLTDDEIEALERLCEEPEGVEALRAWTGAMPEAAAIRVAWETRVDEELEAELAKRGYD
ncbi:MAG: hypothetical protein R2834_08885 [Rhodothermales bacterium]